MAIGECGHHLVHVPKVVEEEFMFARENVITPNLNLVVYLVLVMPLKHDHVEMTDVPVSVCCNHFVTESKFDVYISMFSN